MPPLSLLPSQILTKDVQECVSAYQLTNWLPVLQSKQKSKSYHINYIYILYGLLITIITLKFILL